jgi:protein-tyrosine phosphatase
MSAPGFDHRDRLVPLEGTMNCRDIGGYVGDGGRRVRWGCVYRSDNLAGLTADDVAHLGALGVKVVVDFRHDVEVENAPTPPLGAHVETLRLPIGGEAAEGREMLDRVLAGEFDGLDAEWFADIYVQMLEAGASEFGRVVAMAADPANHALLFHCTAGKDRTGMASALLLRTLGVAEADVLDDYELTTHYRSGRRLAQLQPQFDAAGIDIGRFLPFFTAERSVLAAALAALDERYGGVAGYLVGPAGIDPATLDRLRHALLEEDESSRNP